MKIFTLSALFFCRIHQALPTCLRKSVDAPILPLFGYAAVAIKDGEFFVAAKRTDDPVKWNPLNYPQDKLEEGVSYLKEEMPENRLVEHLAHCALEYHCLTASNIFLNRWEAEFNVSYVQCRLSGLHFPAGVGVLPVTSGENSFQTYS